MPDDTIITAAHEDKETFTEDFNVPAHEQRETTPLFTRTRHEVLTRDGAKCFCCGLTEAQTGKPLEAHHWLIERCLAAAVNWREFCWFIANLKKLVDAAYDFCQKNPNLTNVMDFVDNMTVNGMLLCKEHHTAKGTGIHRTTFSFWLLQCFGLDGYKYTDDEILRAHDIETGPIDNGTVPTTKD